MSKNDTGSKPKQEKDRYFFWRELLKARGTPFDEDDLHKLVFSTDEKTVFTVYHILAGANPEEAIRRAKERWLPHGSADILRIVQEERFVSSVEVMSMTRMSNPSASNKLAALERDYVLRKAFSFVAKPGGGRRFYFCYATDEVFPQDVEDFCKKLETGTFTVLP